jgi:hypothetical protein
MLVMFRAISMSICGRYLLNSATSIGRFLLSNDAEAREGNLSPCM